MSVVALALSAVAAGAPSASAATTDVGIQSARGSVHGGYTVWRGVDPFSGAVGTTIEGEGFLATCKRWGADERWWYWARLDLGGLTGHIPGYATNLAHSHLRKCG